MNRLADIPLSALLATHPCVADFLASLGLPAVDNHQPLVDWLALLPDEAIFDAGMDREQMLAHIGRLIAQVETLAANSQRRVSSLTLIGGRDKAGRPEDIRLTLKAGEIVCIVGPTGSGKSRLLADIECLAQGDTPTGRQILVDEQIPDEDWRYVLDRKLVAQL